MYLCISGQVVVYPLGVGKGKTYAGMRAVDAESAVTHMDGGPVRLVVSSDHCIEPVLLKPDKGPLPLARP